jgi:hypothetical protein
VELLLLRRVKTTERTRRIHFSFAFSYPALQNNLPAQPAGSVEFAMKIRFETTIDDVIAFNRFHFANSPTWRRQVWTQMLLVPGILAILLIVVFFLSNRHMEEDWTFGILAVVLLPFSVVWAVFMRWRLNAALESNTRKFLAEGSNRVMFGWREMELVNNRLVLKTELIESRLDLRAVEKIVSDGSYTFVYIGSTVAYLIPMRLYPEDEYRAFVDELCEAWENRDAPRLTDEETPRSRQPDERIVERPT